MVSILINIIQHEQYFFSFQTTSCLSLMSHHRVNNKRNNSSNNSSKRTALKITNFLLCNVTCFQKQPPLFLKVSQIPQENTCAGVCFSLKWWNCIKTFVLHEQKWIFIQQMWVGQWRNNAIHWWIFFFNLHLRQMQCSVYLTN